MIFVHLIFGQENVIAETNLTKQEYYQDKKPVTK